MQRRDKRHCCYWTAPTSSNALPRAQEKTVMSWLVIGFWGCAAMWLISLAGDLGLARNPEVAEGLQWLPLISAIIAFIGMCYFGHATSMFGW